MWTNGRLADESGYSLVEVTVAMSVLALAILPTVSLFEAGLRAATVSGDHDAARALANDRLEAVRALPYSRPGGAADSAVERYAPPGPPDDVAAGGLSVSVRTAFLDGEFSSSRDSPPTGQMRVNVAVEWEEGSFSTAGIVSGEPP